MIQKIEELSMNAFPALSTVLLNGWVLRFSEGYARRANSVYPIYDCSIDILNNIELCEELYKSKGLDTSFKLTESSNCYKIDEMLTKRGYAYEAKTHILLKEITEYKVDEKGLEVTIYREVKEDWFEAFCRMNKVGEKNSLILKKMIERIIPDIYCACIIENGEIIAVGMGVAQEEYIGMYDICVAEDQQKKGSGTRIMKALIKAGSKAGCKYSYLQVMDANEGAKILYDKLGYKKQYSYWYRVKKLQ